MKDHSEALEIARWFCPSGYVVTYCYDTSTTRVLIPELSGGMASNERRITFSRSSASVVRGKARYLRFIRTDNRWRPVRLVRIDAFDYSGQKLVPVRVSLYPERSPMVALANPSGAMTKGVIESNLYHILIDFGVEVEIAGASIFNNSGADGAYSIGCSLQILTASGRAVFGVPIRDNRAMYNIRTSPLDASLKREQVIRNREVIAVSEPCFPCVCCNKTVMRPRYEVIKRDESKAMQEAVATPAFQLAAVEQVDFACPKSWQCCLQRSCQLRWLQSLQPEKR